MEQILFSKDRKDKQIHSLVCFYSSKNKINSNDFFLAKEIFKNMTL